MGCPHTSPGSSGWSTWGAPRAVGCKVKILEDRSLTGHKVHLVDGKMKKIKVEPSPVAGVAEEEKGGAQLLLEQITPLLQKWLEENLKFMGFSKKPSGRDANAAQAKGQAHAGKKAEKTNRPQKMNLLGARGGEIHSTIVPNAALWSQVVGRKADRAPNPPLPAGSQQGGGTFIQKPSSKPTRKGSREKSSAPPQGAQNKKAPKRRPPRTAAVTFTCPGSYAEMMRIARESINLQEIGIQELRPKRAATGVIVLEVPGPNGAERASVLKEKMEEALRDREGVRVARPTSGLRTYWSPRRLRK